MVQTDAFTQAPPMISFADMDRDGMSDMVYYQDAAIYTLYNKKRANPASDDSLCIKPPAQGGQQNLIGPANRLFSTFADVSAGRDVGSYDVNQTLPMFAGLVSPSAGIPGRIRIADIDANGYPDIIATFKLAG